VQLHGVLRNLTGFSNALTLILGNSEGSLEKDKELMFILPLSGSETNFEVHYAKTHNRLLEQPVAKLNVQNDYLSHYQSNIFNRIKYFFY